MAYVTHSFACQLHASNAALSCCRRTVVPSHHLTKLLVGELRKTRQPRNVEVNEICDASFQGRRTHEDLESGTHEVSESRMRTPELSKPRNREHVMARNLGPAKP
jgi:hypothetical protein